MYNCYIWVMSFFFWVCTYLTWTLWVIFLCCSLRRCSSRIRQRTLLICAIYISPNFDGNIYNHHLILIRFIACCVPTYSNDNITILGDYNLPAIKRTLTNDMNSRFWMFNILSFNILTFYYLTLNGVRCFSWLLSIKIWHIS